MGIFAALNLNMDYPDLKEWVEKQGDFPTGLALYMKLGNNAYLKNVFFQKQPVNSFMKEKLRSELTAIYKAAQPVVNVPVLKGPEVIKTKPKKEGLETSQFFDLPKELQKKRLEISQLYAQAMNMRRVIRREINMAFSGSVTLEEAFLIMNQVDSRGNNIPFDLVWVTYNDQTNEGGDVKNLPCVIKWGNKSGSRFKATPKELTKKVNANHQIHGTFNVLIKGSIEIRKVHTWLMVAINGKEIII